MNLNLTIKLNFKPPEFPVSRRRLATVTASGITGSLSLRLSGWTHATARENARIDAALPVAQHHWQRHHECEWLGVNLNRSGCQWPLPVPVPVAPPTSATASDIEAGSHCQWHRDGALTT